MSSLGRRLQRIEREYRLGPDLAALDDWVQGLELDDLGCVVATGDRPELVRLPEGMTLEQAKLRGYELLQNAPEHIRRLFDEDEGGDDVSVGRTTRTNVRRVRMRPPEATTRRSREAPPLGGADSDSLADNVAAFTCRSSAPPEAGGCR